MITMYYIAIAQLNNLFYNHNAIRDIECSDRVCPMFSLRITLSC
jgi:hypothetical protein